METKFNGVFYIDNKDRKCRKYLDIMRENTERESPQIMVVMMNPGASYPLDNNDNGDTLTEIEPECTQYQIVRVMEKLDIQYARVLNLSDLRESESENFFEQITRSDDLSHSIFDGSRNADFEQLFIRNIPVICAWGVSTKLRRLINLAVSKILSDDSFRLCLLGKSKNNSHFYYHPNQRSLREKAEWVSTIVQQYRDWFPNG